jgi:PHD/YefM family antitoxin component YafN of YafNO toxin-antitoxin module
MHNTYRIKPICYFKNDAAQVEIGAPLIITQNGKTKLVVQDVQTYEATQHTIALLKILAIGQKQIEHADHEDGDEFFFELNELDRKRNLR